MHREYEKNIRSFKSQLSYAPLSYGGLTRLRGKSYKSIILSGMGGSGLAGDIMSAVGHEFGLRVPVLSWKSFGLPPAHILARYPQPLYVCTSFSGNTAETLEAFRTAHKGRGRGRMAVVAGGGSLLALAIRTKTPYVQFPQGNLTPRQATGMMFYSLAKILHAANLITQVRTHNVLSLGSARTAGKRLARHIGKKLILIYTSPAYEHIGRIWKIKFNETAKAFAFSNVLPEMDHNELVSLSGKKLPQYITIFLEDARIDARMAKRFKVTEKLARAHGAHTVRVPLVGRSLLEATWRSVVLAEWTAYYTALIRKENPKETPIIDTLKRLTK